MENGVDAIRRALVMAGHTITVICVTDGVVICRSSRKGGTSHEVIAASSIQGVTELARRLRLNPIDVPGEDGVLTVKTKNKNRKATATSFDKGLVGEAVRAVLSSEPVRTVPPAS